MQKRVDAEAARIEAERERIRAEEQHRAQMEAAESMKAEQAEREAEAKRQAILSEAAKPAVTRALEEIERHKSDPRFAAVVASAPSPADESPTLTLGAINERLHPISLSAAGLAEFGIEPLATRKAAKLYSHAQFEQACQAIVRCATEALRGELEAA